MKNHLATESSPYLLQHAQNPVDWYPWGDEALERARKEDKPILLSIGYSACHWCHVMAHESFENTPIAELMNASFINIKSLYYSIFDNCRRLRIDSYRLQCVDEVLGCSRGAAEENENQDYGGSTARKAHFPPPHS